MSGTPSASEIRVTEEFGEAPVVGRLFPSSALICFFFLSGAAGLIYQTLWSRHLQLIFGSTTEAVSVVLATFMSGLGLGSYLFAARADRMRQPIRLYAYLEIGIGIFAILTTPLLLLATTFYSTVARSLDVTGAPAVLLKLFVSVLVLLPPATLMGGTFPAIVRTPTGVGARRRVAALYAVNILGAVAGTLVTGFYFIHNLGLSRTMLLAAALNVLIGVIVLLMARRFDAPAEVASAEDAPSTLSALREFISSRTGRLAGLGLFVSGATTMLYEVIFTRLLVVIFGVSTHAFTIVLAAFLTGLGLGALILAFLLRRRQPTFWGFSLSQLLVAAAATLMILVLPIFPRLLVYLHQIPGLDYWDVFGAKAVLLFLVLLPVATLAGLSTPLLIAAMAGSEKNLSRSVGAAYVVNTIGTLLGSMAAGFLVIPLLGSEAGLKLTIAINVAVAVAAAFRSAQRRQALVALALAAAIVATAVSSAWPIDLYLRSDSRWGVGIFETRLAMEQDLSTRATDLLFFREGRNATVAVTGAGGSRVLLVNGHPDASDRLDMSTQSFLAIVPLLVKGSARDVMVIGFGSGVTADRVRRSPSVESVDVVEIEKAVVDASPMFHHVNHEVELGPKVDIIYDDARTVLQSRDERYDLIISEPSNPWRAGIAALFTRDFYRLASSRLHTGGVFAQWVQLYGIETKSLAMILHTMSSVFPHTQVWLLDGSNIVILGSATEMRVRLDRLRGEIWSTFGDDLKRYAEMISPDELLGFYLGTHKSLSVLAPDAQLHTDDLPILEAAAEEGLFEARYAKNAQVALAAKLTSGAMLPPLAAGQKPADMAAVWLGIARAYLMARDPDAARVAANHAFELAKSGPVKAEAAVLAAEYTEDCDTLQPFVEFRSARVALARCLLHRHDVRGAVAHLQAAGKLTPEEMYTIAPLLTRAGQSQLSLSIYKELIPRIRLGGPIGAAEGIAVLRDVTDLRKHGHSASELMQLVEEFPPIVGTAPILRARALLHYGAGNHRAALPMLTKLRELGWLEEETLLAEVDSAERVLPKEEVLALRRKVEALAPEATRKDVISPLLQPR